MITTQRSAFHPSHSHFLHFKLLLSASLALGFGTSVVSLAAPTISPTISPLQEKVLEKIAESQLRNEKKSNLIVSRASINSLLAMVGLGYNDDTRKVLEEYLGQSTLSAAKLSKNLNFKSKGVTITAAGNIWSAEDHKFENSFLQDVKDSFAITPGILNVSQPESSADTINKWAADQSNNLIKEVIKSSDITADTISILAQALYFKGEWKTKFDAQLTTPEKFTSVSARGVPNAVTVPTMHATEVRVKYSNIKSEDAKQLTVVELPYIGESHVMRIVFPSVTATENFTSVIQCDPSTDIGSIYQSEIVGGMGIKLELPNEKLQSFSLPKFTIESAHNNIHDQLRQSGLEKLFGAGDTLSRMTADPRAQLSLVKQKAKIIVNEEGSEAAAVTIGGIATASVRTSIELKVNGPFAFAIVEKAAQEVLFEGIVRDPLEQQ